MSEDEGNGVGETVVVMLADNIGPTKRSHKSEYVSMLSRVRKTSSEHDSDWGCRRPLMSRVCLTVAE